MVPYYVIANYYVAIFLPFLCSSNFVHVFAQHKLETVHQWKQVDFTYANTQARDAALRTKKYVPENCLLLDVDVWHKPIAQDRIIVDSGHISNNQNSAINPTFKRRVFVTLPRFKSGVPVTLATITNQRRGDNTLLAPFPNWDAQRQGNCEGVTSVYRIKIDRCGILWVLDSGRIENFSPNPRTICQPQVLAYDLNNGDKLIRRFRIPSELLASDSLLVTIAVDTRDEFCDDTFIYIADVTAFKLIVYDVRNNNAWRVGSNLFYPYPLDGKFSIAGISFNLMDGLLALALGPLQNGDRQLYFHSLASVREGSVSTSVIRNGSLFKDDEDSSWDSFVVSDPARPSQSASEDISESGIMFFGLLSELALGCWNSHTPFTPDNIHITHQDNETMQFPSGMKVIGDSIWMLSNQLQNFIAGTSRPTDVKYRILTGSVSQLIHGTGCDLRDPFYTFDDGTFNDWEVRYPKLVNELTSTQWEPLKINGKRKSQWKQHQPPQRKPQKFNFKQQRQRPRKPAPQRPRAQKTKPTSSTWWSYDCRFQNYGSYSSFHVMCYFLGPSFVHYHNKHYTTNFL